MAKKMKGMPNLTLSATAERVPPDIPDPIALAANRNVRSMQERWEYHVLSIFRQSTRAERLAHLEMIRKLIEG